MFGDTLEVFETRYFRDEEEVNLEHRPFKSSLFKSRRDTLGAYSPEEPHVSPKNYLTLPNPSFKIHRFVTADYWKCYGGRGRRSTKKYSCNWKLRWPELIYMRVAYVFYSRFSE